MNIGQSIKKGRVLSRVAYINAKSINFDGVNDYVNIAHHASIDFERTDTFSFGFWAKSSTSSGTEHIFGKFDGGRGYYVSYDNGANRLNFIIANATGNRIFGFRSLSFDFDDGVWRHYLLTYNGNSLFSGVKLYINGVVVSTTVSEDNLSATIKHTNDLRVANLVGSSSYLEGNVDEYSIWNRELTSTEALSIGGGLPINLSRHPTATNLVLYHRNGDLDDAFPTIKDRSVNSNDGTMTSMDSGDIVSDVP